MESQFRKHIYEPLLDRMCALAAHIIFLNETILVQKVVSIGPYIQSSFAFLFLNNTLSHQLVTMQGKVFKI